jgi:phosphoribosylformylglycinamidine synthase
MGLNDGEYSKILELLEREPTLTEIGMFSVMWSEHCGYKYSRPVLAYFKKYKEAIEGKGLENAGIIDIGDGLGITMKVESHNHPSAIEPYQGAATGVGGIIRDIFTMGARPIALLNSLRFGPIREGEAAPEVVERNRYLFDHVVAGIAGYGNCVGVPTVAGEVAFHSRYSGNPLVNAMCVGILNLEQITTAAASGEGNPVYYLGSATGKDGIHGASFASTGFTEDDEDKRPNVQIGDPFAEKQLIEATLEALATGAIVAIQDMGAAGLTCSTVEMASMGDVGMHIDLDKVPMRESDMSAYELMLSESQERMFAVVQNGREREVEEVFKKWGLHVVPVGIVSGACRAEVKRFGKTEVDLDPRFLTDHCPTYSPPSEVPDYHIKAQDFNPTDLPQIDPTDALLRLLSSPNLASKRYVWQQYDQQVLTQTAVVSGIADAAVLAPRGTKKGIAVKIDGNARHVYFDPYVGGQLAICEASRNVACVGAIPVAATDGLNFGNPQRPHVFWQFEQAVKGIADAAEAMQTPIISGNVSFYNEDSALGLEVLPTPLIGMAGVLEDSSNSISMVCRSDWASIMLISTSLKEVRQEGLGASDFAAEICGIEDGLPVAPNLQGERNLCHLLASLASSGLVEFAHDSSEGGIALAAAEVAIASNAGIQLQLSGDGFQFAESPSAAFFGELPGRVLIGVTEANRDQVFRHIETAGLNGSILGSIDSSEREVRIIWRNTEIFSTVENLRSTYESAIPGLMA